jgi:hypothetical protein
MATRICFHEHLCGEQPPLQAIPEICRRSPQFLGLVAKQKA